MRNDHSSRGVGRKRGTGYQSRVAIRGHKRGKKRVRQIPLIALRQKVHQRSNFVQGGEPGGSVKRRRGAPAEDKGGDRAVPAELFPLNANSGDFRLKKTTALAPRRRGGVHHGRQVQGPGEKIPPNRPEGTSTISPPRDVGPSRTPLLEGGFLVRKNLGIKD